MNALILAVILGQCGPSGCYSGPSGCYSGQGYSGIGVGVDIGRQQSWSYNGSYNYLPGPDPMYPPYKPQVQPSRFKSMPVIDPNIVLVQGFIGGIRDERPLTNGFVVSLHEDKAFICTALHLVSGCTKYSIEYSKNKIVEAVLIGSDPELDVAVFYAYDLRSTRSTVTFADREAQKGERIQFIGYKSSYPNGVAVRNLVYAQGLITDPSPSILFKFKTNPNPVDGISGSPIILLNSSSKQGLVVGMVHAVGYEDAEAVKGPLIHQFALKVISEFINKREVPEVSEVPEISEVPEVPEVSEVPEYVTQIELNEQKTLILNRIEEVQYDDTEIRNQLVELKKRVALNEQAIAATNNIVSNWENLDPNTFVTKEELNGRLNDLYTITDVTQVDGTVLRQKRKLGEVTHLKLFPVIEDESK